MTPEHSAGAPPLPPPTGPLPPHLHLLLDVIDEPALLVQSDGLVMGVNTAMAQRLKLERTVFPGRHLADLIVSPSDDAAVYLRRASGSRDSIVGVLVFHRADGDIFSARCHGCLVHPPDGDSAAMLLLRCREQSEALSPFLELNRRLDALTKEIARRQRAEARLQIVNRDLETRVIEAIADREHAQERLAQAQRLEALGQLAAGIAHDFNNVLQAVSGGLALIHRRADNGTLVRQFARMALDAAERGAAITGRLLSFARQGELRAEAIDAGQLLAALHEMLVPTLGTSIVIHIKTEAPTLWLYTDKSQIETILVNLAINARDAMPDGGTLTIAAASETVGTTTRRAGLAHGNYVRLTVTDSGVGMDAATLARAADPFFTTKPVGQGTGLGLAMARGFTQQSDGGFAIESTPGLGTTVTLWLPEAADPDPESASARHETAASHDPTVFRVLVVDDDPLVREVLANQLQDQGYEIIQASDGLAALAWLDKSEPLDLLVTDFAMPGMNGLALIKDVRRRRPALPALLLTGYADAGVQRSIDDMTSGRPVLLRKPVRSDELAERAAALLSGTGGGSNGTSFPDRPGKLAAAVPDDWSAM